MHVKFTSDFDWHPKYGVTIAYKAGWSGSVTRRCGEAAIAKGLAERIKTPKRVEKIEASDGQT